MKRSRDKFNNNKIIIHNKLYVNYKKKKQIYSMNKSMNKFDARQSYILRRKIVLITGGIFCLCQNVCQ